MLQLSHIRCDRANVITFLFIRVFLMCSLLRFEGFIIEGFLYLTFAHHKATVCG